MIKTVLFDFVNTLAYLNPRREDILKKHIEIKEYPNRDQKDIIAAFLRTDEECPYSSVKILTEEDRRAHFKHYNKKLFKQLNIPESDDFYDYYTTVPKKWELDDEALPVLKNLKERGCDVGVISNFDRGLESVLAELGIAPLIDFLVVSQQIGLEKPDIEFYKYVQMRYNIDVENTLYVGDSLSLDYLPARQVGIESYLLDKNDFYGNEAERVKSLLEILDHVT